MQEVSARAPERDAPLPAVVLAAGYGSRLEEATNGSPKVLVPVAGRPLIAHTLDALQQAGCNEICVVTGYRAAEVEQALRALQTDGRRLQMILNSRYDLPNASSLAAARAWIGARPFLLLMADHLLSTEAIARMLLSAYPYAVGIDRSPLTAERIAEATKVAIADDGRVVAFGKNLARWHGIDAGIFRLLPDLFADLDRLGHATELSALLTTVAARVPFYTVDLTGAFWLDVDTPADLADAEALLRRRDASAAAPQP